MDSNTFTALVAISSTLLGVVVGGIVNNYIMKKQDERKFKHEKEESQALDRKKRAAAYRRLWSITERVLSQGTAAEPVRLLSNLEYETIESIIEQNADVLAKTTVAAWDTKSISTPQHIAGVLVLCAAFWPDVKKHYEELRYNAIPSPESATTEQ